MFSWGQNLQHSSSDASNGHAAPPTPQALPLATSTWDASSRQQTVTGAETTFPPQHVESLPDGIAPPSRGTSQKNFLSRLYTLVNDPTNWEVVRWAEDGNGFVIVNQEKFRKEILGSVFKHNTLASFVQLLIMYDIHRRNRAGRRKGKNDTLFFQHQDGLFRRGRPDILQDIKRKGPDTGVAPYPGLGNGHATTVPNNPNSLPIKKKPTVKDNFKVVDWLVLDSDSPAPHPSAFELELDGIAALDSAELVALQSPTTNGFNPSGKGEAWSATTNNLGTLQSSSLNATTGVPYTLGPVDAFNINSSAAPSYLGPHQPQHAERTAFHPYTMNNDVESSLYPAHLFDINGPIITTGLDRSGSPVPPAPTEPNRPELYGTARLESLVAFSSRAPSIAGRNSPIGRVPLPRDYPVPTTAYEASGRPVLRHGHSSKATSSQDRALVHYLDGHSIVRESHIPFNTSGAFCDVFIGSHPLYNKVVLKRPRMTAGGSKGNGMKHFRTEAEIWSKLQHPNILHFIGMIEAENYIWLVSPFAANGSLPDYIKANPETDREKLVLQLMQAIEYLHRQDIVHGDIYQTDTQSAKYQDMKTATSLKGAGTWHWSAPELLLVEGASKTTASDVYAFGMTIYQILSGNIPFESCSVPALVIAISSNKRPPKEPVASLSGSSYAVLWEIAEACWVAEAEDRPTMSAVQARFGLGPVNPFDTVSSAPSYSGRHQSRPIEGTAFYPSVQNDEIEIGLPRVQPFVGVGAYRALAYTPFHNGIQENLFSTRPTIDTAPSSSYGASHVSLPPLSPVIPLVGSTNNIDDTTLQAPTFSSGNGSYFVKHPSLQDSIRRGISSIGQRLLLPSLSPGFPA